MLAKVLEDIVFARLNSGNIVQLLVSVLTIVTSSGKNANMQKS